jgi:hypothetical protein
MLDGEITGNTADAGGGVYTQNYDNLLLPKDGRIAFGGNRARNLYRLTEAPPKTFDGVVTEISVPRLNAHDNLANDPYANNKSVFNNFDIYYSTENPADILDLCDLRYTGISGESLDALSDPIPLERGAQAERYTLADGSSVKEADFLWKLTRLENAASGIAVTRAAAGGSSVAPASGDKLPPAEPLLLRSEKSAGDDTAVLSLYFSAVSRDARVLSVAGEAVFGAEGDGTKENPFVLSPVVNAGGLPRVLTASEIGTHEKATVRLCADASFDTPVGDDGVTLSAGVNLLYIEVTAQDEDVKLCYKASVYVDANEAGVRSVAGVSVTPTGAGAGTKESPAVLTPVGVDYGRTEITAAAPDGIVTAHPGARARLFADANFENAVQSVSLSVGGNTLYIEVTAEDGKTIRYYTVTATRAGGGNPGGNTESNTESNTDTESDTENNAGGGTNGESESEGADETSDEYPSGGTDPDVPPRPVNAGGSLTPVAGADNAYVEIGEDGTPLGEWHYDPERGEWIFNAYPPPLSDLPQTGGPLAKDGMPFALPALCVLFTTAAGLAIRTRRRGKTAERA